MFKKKLRASDWLKASAKLLHECKLQIARAVKILSVLIYCDALFM